MTREELGRNPDVHHIVPVRWFIDSGFHTIEDAHFLDNVASLCSSCHRKAEYGKIAQDELRSLIGAE
ncbi:HNH endonuclease [Haladaptatus sp. CMAA 1911]|uniref:HNH endonuclease n=1 Tax=unclassified Haladaptatus TaxID=2622732 RepID=UPI003754060E